MATKIQILNFNNTLTSWRNSNFNRIFRSELGLSAFKNIRERIEDFSLKIEKVDLVKEQISDRTLAQIINTYNTVLAQLNGLSSMSDVDFLKNIPSVEKQIEALHEQMLVWWPQVLPFVSAVSQTEIDNLINQLKTSSIRSENDARTIEELKAKLTYELENFDNRYKEQFQRVELMKQQDIFSVEATKQKKISWYWLIAIGLSLVFFIISLWSVFKYSCFEMPCFSSLNNLNYEGVCKDCSSKILNLEIFKAISYRIFYISFVVYIITFCVKNYNACMHNVTINNHKANSLSAAIALLNRAKTNEGNDQIMFQAANTIFSHQPTGYNNKDLRMPVDIVTDKVFEKIKK